MCDRCHDTGVILVGGSTGPYGDDPLMEVPCPVCVTGEEEPRSMDELDGLDEEPYWLEEVDGELGA